MTKATKLINFTFVLRYPLFNELYTIHIKFKIGRDLSLSYSLIVLSFKFLLNFNYSQFKYKLIFISIQFNVNLCSLLCLI